MFFGEVDRGRSMCVTRRCRFFLGKQIEGGVCVLLACVVCVLNIFEEFGIHISITTNYVYKVWYV
jgi:hypothetical protein